MKTTQLSGSPRENVGKKEAAALRRADRVPAVLYGGKTQAHFSVGKLELEKLVYTPDVYRIELDIDGTKTDAIIKEVQFHPVTDEAIHVDFLELDPKRPVVVRVPVRVVGNSIGVRNGGRLMQLFRKMELKGLPDAIPSEVEVDISPLRIGQSIRVKQLDGNSAEFLNSPDAVVVMVARARGAVDDEEEGDEEEGEEGASEEGETAEKAE